MNVKFSPPTYNQVQLEAHRIGLPQEEAELFYSHFQSNGWKVGRVQMKSWTDALLAWKIRWSKTSTSGLTRSVWEMTKIIEAKQKVADDLKRKHSTETAHGRSWKDEKTGQRYRQLVTEIRLLNERLAEM